MGHPAADISKSLAATLGCEPIRPPSHATGTSANHVMRREMGAGPTSTET
jgi:hypothetical protein